MLFEASLACVGHRDVKTLQRAQDGAARNTRRPVCGKVVIVLADRGQRVSKQDLLLARGKARRTIWNMTC